MESMELMHRVHAGDGEAFKALYAQYSETVYRIAYEELQDQQRSLNVVKTVFRMVYQTLREQGPIEGDLVGWLQTQTKRELDRHKQDTASTAVPPASPPVFTQRAAAVPKAPRKVTPAPPVPPPAPALPARRYTQQEARAIEARAQARITHMPLEEEPAPQPIRLSSILTLAGGILLCLFLLWTLIGLLMRLGVLPQIDLGYRWFDDKLFPLFF